MIVIDASVWVSWFFPPDRFHEVSRIWLSRMIAAGETIVIPSLALTEVAGGVARRSGRPALGRGAALKLLDVPTLEVDPVDEALALLAASCAADLKLKGSDAVYVAVAYGAGIPLATWDREQATRSRPLITTLQPHV